MYERIFREQPTIQLRWTASCVNGKKLKAFLRLLLLVTFKDLQKIIAEKNKEIERQSKFYNTNYSWKGRKVVSLNQWLKIKNNYGLNAALKYFPNDFPRSGFTFILYGIEDQTQKQVSFKGSSMITESRHTQCIFSFL